MYLQQNVEQYYTSIIPRYSRENMHYFSNVLTQNIKLVRSKSKLVKVFRYCIVVHWKEFCHLTNDLPRGRGWTFWDPRRYRLFWRILTLLLAIKKISHMLSIRFCMSLSLMMSRFWKNNYLAFKNEDL